MKETNKQRNLSFICKCGLCKQDVFALSEIRLLCGYDSSHDLECVQLNLCGACADAFYILLGGSADSTNK